MGWCFVTVPEHMTGNVRAITRHRRVMMELARFSYRAGRALVLRANFSVDEGGHVRGLLDRQAGFLAERQVGVDKRRRHVDRRHACTPIVRTRAPERRIDGFANALPGAFTAAAETAFFGKDPDAELICQLTAAGVSDRLCGQSMMSAGFARNELNADIKVDIAAITTMATFPLRGYAVITD